MNSGIMIFAFYSQLCFSDKLWAENDYETSNLALESDEESDSTDIEDDEDDGPRQINYVLGDVTHPREKHTKDKDAVIVHCVGK
jgi:hypothetical protein